jgi:hypothetical protein
MGWRFGMTLDGESKFQDWTECLSEKSMSRVAVIVAAGTIHSGYNLSDLDFSIC